MDLENVPPTLQIGFVDGDLSVEASRSGQGLVEDIDAVRPRQNHDT